MNTDICQHESQIPHPLFYLFCLAHLFYWPGIMVGGVNEPLPGTFVVSFIDNFPFIQSPFRGPQIPEIKELLGASSPVSHQGFALDSHGGLGGPRPNFRFFIFGNFHPCEY